MRALRTALVISIAAAAFWIARASSHSSPPAAEPLRCGFDFPVGAPDGIGYYDAQPFGDNDHLGNDWNGLGGGDTDLGQPVYAVADGVVLDARDHGGGWGNVVRVAHPCAGDLESLYAHLDVIEVEPGAVIARGDRIGTIGDAGGRYRAHLHFELRERAMALGDGYSADRDGYLDATAHIRRHRPAEHAHRRAFVEPMR